MGREIGVNSAGDRAMAEQVDSAEPAASSHGVPANVDVIGQELQERHLSAVPGTAASDITDRSSVPVQETLQSPLVAAWQEVFTKLFVSPNGDKQRLVYDQELSECENKGGYPPGTILAAALNQLSENQVKLVADARGQIVNPAEVGDAFALVYKLANEKVEISIADSTKSLNAPSFPLSFASAKSLEPITNEGHAVIVMLTKEPPLSAALELRRVAEEKFGGLISLWERRDLWDAVGVSQGLRDYLSHATVRIVTTAKDTALNQVARGLNTHLEREGGFEDARWISIAKSVTQGDRHHALKEALMVCGPVVLGVKALESFAPGLMHAIGGMLDDLFGAILPDVSQSMGRKGAPFRERLKEAWPVLKAGLASLPLALGCGWLASTLHSASSSVAVHAVSGALFALACSAGTLGTSIGAFSKARKTVEALRSDPAIGKEIEKLGRWGRTKLALQESIFDVPFRVGHTVAGVPLQFALGIAAGVGGFFHNGLFVMAEGMLETILGAGTAFGYPAAKQAYDRWRLKRI